MMDNIREENHAGTLIFVYNADSGLFNTLTDIAHKIFSPSTYQCHLCELSHGYFTMRNDWAGFIDELDMNSEFLHRDDFVSRYGYRNIQFPAILVRHGSNLDLCVDAAEINACSGIEDLKGMIKNHCIDSSGHE